MKMVCLETMSDREVVARLGILLREERRLTAEVLVHLGEVEARRLYLPAACSSMFVYCTRVLGMSEDQAFKRIRAARAVRRFPVVGAAVAEGRLHLSGVVLLAPHLSDDNTAELVVEASGKSKAEIEVLLARRAPRPDVAQRLERVAEQMALVVPGPVASEVVPGPVASEVVPGPVASEVVPGPVASEVVPGPVASEVVPGPVASRLVPGPVAAPKVRPLSPERFALQLTIGEATRSKLLRAQALMRHQVPSGDLSEILDRALDALLEKVEAKKFGTVKAPRAAKASRRKRYVPHEARRQAVARDGERCAFVAADGRRCEETGFLELDHALPVAKGGDASEGVRILCRSHNQYEAERILGRGAVEAGRAATEIDHDLVAGLRGMGVTASDARKAVAESRSVSSLEERMRSALRALGRLYAGRGGGARCEEPRREYEGVGGPGRDEERTSGRRRTDDGGRRRTDDGGRRRTDDGGRRRTDERRRRRTAAGYFFFFFFCPWPPGFFLAGPLVSVATASGRGSLRFFMGPNMSQRPRKKAAMEAHWAKVRPP